METKKENQSKYADLLTIEPFVRVEADLLAVLAMYKIDVNEAGAFFVETADKLRTCEPNYRNRRHTKDNVWILRDFFPGTQLMFKMTLVYQTPEMRAAYESRFKKNNFDLNEFAKAFETAIWVNVKLVKSRRPGSRIHIPYKEAQKYLLAKSANIIIGDNIKPEPFVRCLISPPRRMFPKGYNLKSHKRPKKAAHNVG